MTTEQQAELILNVDDTVAARYAKTRILTRAGYRVIEAASGAEALQRARDDAPDLVLLDTKLPDINGFEVCRRLKSDPGTRMVLVLQTSASYVGTPDKIRGLDSGADNYLFEPIEPDELVANVRALMRLGRVERELRDVDRRKDEFLAVLAHELRNPLAPIRNAAELLCKLDPEVPAAQNHARQLILRQSAHMVRLVDDLLDVSRISQGKIALHRAVVELSPILDAAIETAQPNISQRKHALTVTLPDLPLWVHADAVRFAQVIANLLNNASKFTPPGGRIEVAAELVDEQVVISVSDNGIGIAAHHLSSIFDLFAQGGHSADRVKDGLGIGLSLSRKLVALHDGTLAVSSEGEGLGSRFTVTLPALAPAELAAPILEAHAVMNGRRILIVDDNVDSAETLAALLGYYGHQVGIAHDGESAIAIASTTKPDIVFMDVGLPDMSGLAAAERIRANAEPAAIKIVALTGYGSDGDRAAAQLSGIDEYLTKPVTLERLTETIARLSN
ncbi:response regulator [Massilia sp. CF038]|uniref:hybrid sensor histidine kinase/response regulator n=1 Tax=Massilia sp. CF038 TaxID=1881045 RepID=UPI000923F000|nr:response regulator [Massilia sp. CF038]SHG70952.1 Signal transduction histidine kinase [Massilia sp. CF038]